VTDERVKQARISHLAAHDALTGLANRWTFQQRFETLANLPDSNGHFIAIHYIDLDGFKAVNDEAGHPAGDEILKIAASRMQCLVRSTDIVARLGGDEFAVLQLSVKSGADAHSLAERLVHHLSQPYRLQDQTYTISASIGVCMGRADFPKDHLIDIADKALYIAKREGKRRYVYQSVEDAQV